jgi:hypothetical protein
MMPISKLITRFFVKARINAIVVKVATNRKLMDFRALLMWFSMFLLRTPAFFPGLAYFL